MQKFSLMILMLSCTRYTPVIEMRQLTEVQETLIDPANDNRTSDKPENDVTRQGETPEQGASLPP
jgi:hypothetical protein